MHQLYADRRAALIRTLREHAPGLLIGFTNVAAGRAAEMARRLAGAFGGGR